MNIRAVIEQIIHLKNPALHVRILLSPLTAVSWIYGAAMRLRAWLYRACIFESYSLPCPVIAVGNITVGGTGKTPTVCLLAKALAGRGLRVCVITRGYRGEATAAPLMVSDGSSVLASAREAGDEAVMLGRALSGIPVIACRDRVAAGRLACERFSAQAVILDDGFQHLRLRRDLDIVLINAADPFGNGSLLPRGILREPRAALARAGIVVLTKASGAQAVAALGGCIKKYSGPAPVFIASYALRRLRRCATGEEVPPERLAGAPVAALCSIGDPESFLRMLESAGIALSERIVYPDHHGYGPADFEKIQQACASHDAVITTEKDIAKLDGRMLENNKLIVMEIEQVIEPAAPFLNEVLSRSGLA